MFFLPGPTLRLAHEAAALLAAFTAPESAAISANAVLSPGSHRCPVFSIRGLTHCTATKVPALIRAPLRTINDACSARQATNLWSRRPPLLCRGQGRGPVGPPDHQPATASASTSTRN